MSRGVGIVGRSAEIAQLLAIFDAVDGPVVAVVHGPGGVGKTSVLREVERQASGRNRVTRWLDGADLEPTPESVLAAVGLPGTTDVAGSRPALAAALDGALAPGIVILLDRFEALAALGPWLTRVLVPALPSDACLVVAGRRPLTDAADHLRRSGLLLSLALRNLAPADAERLVRSCGVPDEVDLDELVTASHGHPLALVIAADHWLATSGSGATGPATGALLRHPDPAAVLLGRFVDDVDDPTQRLALHVAAHARRVDRDLLQQALDLRVAEADDLLRWLRERPYAESHPDGLALHDLVRDVLDTDLRWRAPAAFADMHHRVRTVILERLRRDDLSVARRAGLDAMFLHRSNPTASAFIDYSRLGTRVLRASRPDDHAVLVELATRSEGPARGDCVAYWLAHQPEQVQVVEDRSGVPVGLSAYLRINGDPDVRAGEPMARAVWAALDGRRSIGIGEVVLSGITAGLGPDRTRGLSDINIVAAHSLIEWSQPGLGWCTMSTTSGELMAPPWSYIGFEPLLELPSPDGQVVSVWARDFARSSYAEWLDACAPLETDNTGQAPAPIAEPIALSRPDFDAQIRAVLRELHRPERFVGSPLLDSSLVRVARSPGDVRAPNGDRAELAARLREVVADAVASLEEDPALAKAARAVDRTYLRAATTQEAAAEVLGVPFSTYRRHLARGVEALADLLWNWEMHGGPPTAPGRRGMSTG